MQTRVVISDEDYAPREEKEQQEKQQINEEDKDSRDIYLVGPASDKIEDQFNCFMSMVMQQERHMVNLWFEIELVLVTCQPRSISWQ